MSAETASINPSGQYRKTTTSTLPGMLVNKMNSMGFKLSFSLSVLVHAGAVFLIILLLFLAYLFDINIPLFKPLDMNMREMTFVLVDNPTAPPRNKNTKNRAKHATRSGGEKKQNNAEPQRKAGSPSKASKPQQAAKPVKASPKPTPKATQPKKAVKPQPPKQPVKKVTPPVQKKSTVTKAAPPQPKLKQPVKTPTKAPSLPTAFKPAIKVPAAPTPKVTSSGPVVKTTSSAGSSTNGQSGSTPMPSQISGSPTTGSRGSQGSPGSRSGQGGYSTYNNAGSPGGGGGRPGIDALPEPDYGAYMAELQRRIKRNWRPPTAQEDKRVVVVFRIGRDGRLLSLRVQESSGFKEADAAALGAVKLSAPFRPLPPNHREDDLAIQFSFDYNVYKNSRGGAARYR